MADAVIGLLDGGAGSLDWSADSDEHPDPLCWLGDQMDATRTRLRASDDHDDYESQVDHDQDHDQHGYDRDDGDHDQEPGDQDHDQGDLAAAVSAGAHASDCIPY